MNVWSPTPAGQRFPKGTKSGDIVAYDCKPADARLFAAAPDMLAALKLIWQMFDDGRIVRNIVSDGKPDWALRMLEFTRELQTIQMAITKAEEAHER